ncbi:MAG: hypothetical protein SVW57_11555 [Thermodesulfobacteriota bacterium]|nr:hypothetical protein [Thermodesulfobacteriota bacterium]
MDREGIIMMRGKELRRLRVIEELIEKLLRRCEAALIVGLSERQVGRLIKRVRLEGRVGVVHRLRGRSSTRRTPEWLKAKVISLYREKYSDFGPTLANEKLLERDGIKISKETLRKWLIEEGLWGRRRWQREHRRWRERR